MAAQLLGFVRAIRQAIITSLNSGASPKTATSTVAPIADFLNQYHLASLLPWTNANSNKIPQLAGFDFQTHEQEQSSFLDSMLWAVPKKRRTLEKRRMRSFGLHDRMEHTKPKENLVICPKCNNWHESHTICGRCYDKVRSKTEEMKAKLQRNDDFLYNQTDVDIKTLEKMMKDDQPDPLSWWNDNLKTKVK